MWEAVLNIVGTIVSLGGNASSAIAHGTPHVCTCLEMSAGAMDSNPAAPQDTASDASADFLEEVKYLDDIGRTRETRLLAGAHDWWQQYDDRLECISTSGGGCCTDQVTNGLCNARLA